MELHELLQTAIREQKPIRYRYAGSDGAHGLRVGSPHALYTNPSTRKINCDIFQHGGDSASGNIQPFKPFTLSKMEDVALLEDQEFRRYERYDADAPRYVNSIAKIR